MVTKKQWLRNMRLRKKCCNGATMDTCQWYYEGTCIRPDDTRHKPCPKIEYFLLNNQNNKTMTLNEYQEKAMTTCMESSDNVAYMMLNLVGELGEAAEKMSQNMTDKQWCKDMKKLADKLAPFGQMAKQIRKEPKALNSADARAAFARLAYLPEEAKLELQKELGDIMWQLNGLMTTLFMTAEATGQQNLDKLADRQERQQIDGDGDNR